MDLVAPDYFATVGIPVVRGRQLGEEDRAGTLPAVVVNQTMADTFWPGKNPLGQRFRFFGDDQPVEVVGVARNANYNGLGEDPQPYIYQPLGQRWTGNLTLLVRTEADPTALLSTVEREIRSLDKGLALDGVQTIGQRLYQGLWAQRTGAALLGLFGLLALILAAGGIYGVTSFVVAQRSREIGIRMALGARAADVLGVVLRQGMQVVLVGLFLGVGCALALGRLAANFLFGVEPTDPWTFGGTVLLLSAVALAANFLPARRASGLDPVRVLRQE